MTAKGDARAGRIVTFYSYKGGTGRSMALANVAWILANSGRRVLMIDWDLEAPGLHRYFEPFLSDKTLEQSSGIIDFVRDFATVAVAGEAADGQDRCEQYSNLLAHAVTIEWDFPRGGLLHMVPAGRQDAAYPVRVNSFDWQDFYERLRGGILLETVKQNLRGIYDFILIDSRTGVSDTSGICTIQMPDELVVCFTLNRQSIYGASAAARSAFRQRHTASGEPTLKIWPVPTRVDPAERDRLEIAFTTARARFAGLIDHLVPVEEDKYWGQISVGYESYYAYEEVLASFRDRPRQAASMLARMETLATYLNEKKLDRAEAIDELRRSEGLAAFTTHSAQDYGEEFAWLGDEYESIRRRMSSCNARTELMTLLVGRVQVLAAQRDAGIMAEKLFSRGSDGGRIVGLALARTDPQRQHIDLALSAIGQSRSAFEQYHALLLADRLLPSLHPSAAGQLQSTINEQLGKTITSNDQSRWAIAQRLLKNLGTMTDLVAQPRPSEQWYTVGGSIQAIADITVSSTHVRYEDVDEAHGDWVRTRGAHTLRLPQTVHMGRYLVTNSLYLKFIQAGGYRNDDLWSFSRAAAGARRRFVTRDGKSMGPGDWSDSNTIPAGKEEHPVSSICYFEARAFVNWCNSDPGENAAMFWTLPPEDHWEFAARSEEGFIYPWGDAFDVAKCNSSESGFGGTTEVKLFESGASKASCCDMAGNVWEFVATEATAGGCVLRGGSFKNDRFVVRSYLRLFGVPPTHRPRDFGFRLSQIERPASA
jgi:formylglycine-generating enzyme required for sulfatase activity/cellulose biosynthesis protein BcsQ